MVMMKIDLFYEFRPCFVPAKFSEVRFYLLSLKYTRFAGDFEDLNGSGQIQLAN